MIQENDTEDILISEENTGGAFQGDEVECIILKSSGRTPQRREDRKDTFSGTVKIVGLYEKNKILVLCARTINVS